MQSSSKLIENQRNYFFTGETKDISFRIKQLKLLKKVIKKNEKQIIDALRNDLNKSEFEAYMTEIGYLYNEINDVLKNIKDWAKPKKVRTPKTHIGSDSYIYPEPYGVVLIIAPWNYPFQLALAPLIGAMATGNCAIIKPSELTPETSAIVAEIIKETYSENYITVVEGAVETSEALLKERFDYIFFTGSVAVGKIVMEAASKYLTPITLELGGKSPTIVHDDAKLEIAAKRIVWGKFINAGQTCVAPDYLLVQKNVKEKLVVQLKKAIKEFYGENVISNSNYPMIVNQRHLDRLIAYLDNGDIVYGGQSEREKRFLEPTLIENVSLDSPIMTDEIFGPILPILEYGSLDEVIEIVRERQNPLALYLFTENVATEKRILNDLSFGGGCINDTIYHLGTPHLPFGGVGESGMGAYHGKFSFDTFSHQKGVLKQTSKFDIPLRYHTTKGALTMIKRVFK
ncbi:aldehyde dehydrogenase [Bacillus sp. FJAT-45350]|uniref:aldehyde dehydrogenase n=1 Tax=Bacillus sp. FJAT-45350 TaxID=2011014 RepID=UPI000BB7B0B0|nr:aldehyde dehydrogenase [Bacillus sp. FJAT-45350]